MLLVVGLILLVAAVVVGVAGVLTNADSAHTLTDDFSVFEKYLEQVNSHIAESSDAYGIPHARIHEAFNGPNGAADPNDKGYIYSDGIHPNDNGHAVIAQELERLGYEPLYR